MKDKWEDMPGAFQAKIIAYEQGRQIEESEDTIGPLRAMMK